MAEHRIYSVPFADIYALYVAKIERKGRAVADLDTIIDWLTGYDREALARVNADKVTLRSFFDQAPDFNENAHLITGVICGKRVEEIADPLMRKVRYLDKLVDELARGKKMASILRGA
ncbi:DUF2200 domain-containing protein [Rarobacter incanus]|uniref:DUF2200 family protein n=1 Tax=Rarobacter incanus TaxID=153494 RepID=A0A542SNC8_9MICO|nr:DUF2200 domain-containing protein [Rarobacter incanus]TQK75767.1 hypothetical protein FB389_0401 [Rarobacter incanus]